MLSFTVIGCGAAGNKAAIQLMNEGYDPRKIHLLNSTVKDLPVELQSECLTFGASSTRLGGCGKERAIGRQMLLQDLKNGVIELNSLVDDLDQAVVLVGSTEGGTGSSSVPILAKYFNEVLGRNVIVVLFFGFNDDVRGMKNTLELCKELSDTYTVIGISNSKFLSTYSNKFKAERAANTLFCNIMRIITGATLVPGTQMIDDTDLYKVVTTPGYCIVNTFDFNRPKTPDQYKDALKKIIANGEFVDPPKNPGAKRIAMIFDVVEIDDNIDYHGEELRNQFGEPFEFFTHLNEKSEYFRVSYIVSGMKLPLEEIKQLYDEYIDRTKTVNKAHDEFFDGIGELEESLDEKGFDMLTGSRRNNAARSAFFEEFGMDDKPTSTPKKKGAKIVAEEEY